MTPLNSFAGFLFMSWALGTFVIIVVSMTTNIIQEDMYRYKTFFHPQTSIWSKYVMPLTAASWVLMIICALNGW